MILDQWHHKTTGDLFTDSGSPLCCWEQSSCRETSEPRPSQWAQPVCVWLSRLSPCECRISSGRRLPAVSSFRCHQSSSPALSLQRPCGFSSHLFIFYCLCLLSSLFQTFSSKGISSCCVLCSGQVDGDWRHFRACARLFLERFSLLWLDFSSCAL